LDHGGHSDHDCPCRYPAPTDFGRTPRPVDLCRLPRITLHHSCSRPARNAPVSRLRVCLTSHLNLKFAT
jgi:hypothetical protein